MHYFVIKSFRLIPSVLVTCTCIFIISYLIKEYTSLDSLAGSLSNGCLSGTSLNFQTTLMYFILKDEKERKKKRKSKNKMKKSSKSAVNQQKYGKYGILMESDMFNKQQEFYLWLQEVKKINPEILPRFEMKKMFDTFAEDYNTVTLPHKKYGFINYLLHVYK